MGKGEGSGGGNDGGVLTSGRAHIVVKEQEKKKDTAASRAARWSTCCLSGESLHAPVVADELGNLFNKEALLSYLLEKRSIPAFSHIRRMKDVFAVTATGVAGGAALFQCPVSQTVANGSHAFVALRPCGCVFGDRALRELKCDACPKCGVAIGDKDNVMRLVPTEEEADFLRERMQLSRQAAAASAAHSKSTGKRSGEARAQQQDAAAAGADATGVPHKRGRETGGAAGSHHAAAAAAPPHAAAASQRAPAAPSSAAAHGHGGAAHEEGVRLGLADSAKREASAVFQKQRESSEVYASLFRTSGDAPGKGVPKTASGAHRW